MHVSIVSHTWRTRAVWLMSESGAIGSWQTRTYVGLPIISSGFQTVASVRGLIYQNSTTILFICDSLQLHINLSYFTREILLSQIGSPLFSHAMLNLLHICYTCIRHMSLKHSSIRQSPTNQSYAPVRALKQSNSRCFYIFSFIYLFTSSTSSIFVQ